MGCPLRQQGQWALGEGELPHSSPGGCDIPWQLSMVLGVLLHYPPSHLPQTGEGIPAPNGMMGPKSTEMYDPDSLGEGDGCQVSC